MSPLDVGRLPGLGTQLALAAERYAELGWPVLQLIEHGKVPVTAHGMLDATTDVTEVRLAWKCRPRCNVGVRIPPGLVVIDVDGPHGVEALRSGGPLPRTLTAATARGWHLWFTAPEGVALRQRAAVLPGVDTRTAARGYVVAPPSIHETGVVYEWARRCAPAPLPAWLVTLLAAPQPAPRPRDLDPAIRIPDRYSAAALEGEARAVAETPPGRRNHRLLAAWLRLTRDHDTSPHLPRDLVRATLTRAALVAGLDDHEIRRTLRDNISDARRAA